MIPGVYHPYVFAKKEDKPMMYENVATEADRRAFSVLDHLMGSRRKWSGIDNRLTPSDAAGKIPGMGTGVSSPEELRIRNFMESCAFKSIISCAGGM